MAKILHLETRGHTGPLPCWCLELALLWNMHGFCIALVQ